ncbi:MAG TPA: serine/threonine-protein kinase [Vicinamibacterales bacterium]|nr:serine/threonine-protein kinase [Vicinamibacterales bacterium]
MPEQSIAHYNLLEPIGREAIGQVYRARDTRVGRTVALKVLDPALVADDTRRTALFDEARLAAKLSHPNIAALFEASESAGVCYFVYEFAVGAPLHEEMGGRPVNPRRAVELCIQIADALADGHAAGILHGDLRPETIGVTAKGSAKLLDFGMWRWTRGGLVRRAAARAPESLPDEDSLIASYMAPEQALGGETDGRADLFSLGTILYEMLTGRNPFKAPNVPDTVMNVVSVTPSRPSASVKDLPPQLDEIAVRALAKPVESRFQSAASFSAELRSVAAALDVRPDQLGGDFLLPVDDDADKTPTAVWAAAAAGVATLGAVVWWLVRS